METMKKGHVIGIFDDEVVLLKAIRNLRSKELTIYEVYSPYPVHGIDDALGYKRSRLPIAAFLFGLTGTICALTMQAGMMTFDWPMIIGGKNFFPLPTFIPVTFELTVLLAAFGMVGVFLVISNLKPWGKPKLFDPRCTDDKHVLVISLSEQKTSLQEAAAIQQLVEENGASEVKHLEKSSHV